MLKRLTAHLALLRVASDRLRRDKSFADDLKAWRYLRDNGQLDWKPPKLPAGAPTDAAQRFEL